MSAEPTMVQVRRVAAGMATPLWVGLGTLLALAVIVGVAGMISLPADEHEVLVLRTATEMHDRGDWLVPYFNGEPRLNKPPMSYWLTGAVAAFAGVGGEIVPWHGRVPSLLAGLGIVIVIVVGGNRLYGSRAALAAGLLFVTSSAYYTYSHDGRPDLLYAFFCTAGSISGLLAQLGYTTRRRLAVYALWLAYALATMTKGPQAPLMLLAAAAIWHWRQRAPWREFAPPGAVILALALVLPWWVSLQLTVGPDEVEHSQLAGRLLVPSFSHFLNGYYLYRPLQLLLPWLPLAPVAWVVALLAKGEQRPATRYLALLVACAIVGFSLGGQQRYFYFLPLMAPMCLIAGRGIDLLLASTSRRVLALWLVQGVVIVAALAWVFASMGAAWLLGPVLTLAGAIGFFAGSRDDVRPVGLLAAFAVMVMLVYVLPHTADKLWSDDRRHKDGLARLTAMRVSKAEPLATYRLTPEIYVYATGRRIPRLRSPEDILRYAGEAGRKQMYVLTEVKYAATLSQRFALEPIRLMPPGAGDRAGLYALTIE